jgi:hypothetical protein
MTESGYKLDAAPYGNISWRTTDIYDLKLNFAFPRFVQIETKIQSLSVPHDDLWSVLQNRVLFSISAAFLHLGKLSFHMCGLHSHRLPLTPHDVALLPHLVTLSPHFMGLTGIDSQSEIHDDKLQDPDPGENPCKPRQFDLSGSVFIGCLLTIAFCCVIGCAGVPLAFNYNDRLRRDWRGLCGCLLMAFGVFGTGCALSVIGFGGPFVFWRFRWLLGEDEYCDNQPFHGETLYYKKFLTAYTLCSTFSGMANVLPKEKQIAVVGALAEGSSVGSIERLTGIHRDTICRLGVRIGKGCEMLLDSKMQDLGCNYLQLDEVWGYIGKKERHCSVDDNPEYGDVWTFCAIDSETKLVHSGYCGARTQSSSNLYGCDALLSRGD